MVPCGRNGTVNWIGVVASDDVLRVVGHDQEDGDLLVLSRPVSTG